MDSWLHRERLRSPWPIVGASSIASTENELETNSSNMSERHQRPPPNTGTPEQEKLSLPEPFRSLCHVDDNPTQPNLPPQPTTSRLISIEPLCGSAPGSTEVRETGGIVGEVVGEARLINSGVSTPGLPSNEDYEIISIEDDDEDDECNKSLGLDWLCTQDRRERRYMTLIPFSLGSKDLRKPSKPEARRVQQLRVDVRRRRREIQDLKALQRAKEQQTFDEQEDAFQRQSDFMAQCDIGAEIHGSKLELAKRLFYASRPGLGVCRSLIDEISSLEERLALKEMKLTEAEDSLYVSFGVAPIESERGRGKSTAILGLPISRLPPTSESEHTSADDMDGAEVEDDDSDDDVYSTGSFEKYRKTYHPLYMEYLEHLGTQENLYERRADLYDDKVRLEDQQQTRHRVGLTLLEDDQDLLDSLPEIIRQLDIEIDESQLQSEQLNAQCLEQGIIDEDCNYIDDAREDSDDSMPLSPPSPPSELDVPPSMRPSTPPRYASYFIAGALGDLGDRLDDQSYQSRINPWLLDKLFASRTELTLLATILSAMDAEPDVASLLDVLKLWDHDGAGIEPPQRLGKLDEATVDKLRRVTRGVLGDGFDRSLVSSLFGLSLWDAEAYPGDEESEYLNDN